MQLEYFKLIDRIVDLNVAERTIVVEAQVPQNSTIFEGHFPGYPIMPGVLLIESMAQTSGWLLLALMKFGDLGSDFFGDAALKNLALRRQFNALGGEGSIALESRNQQRPTGRYVRAPVGVDRS